MPQRLCLLAFAAFGFFRRVVKKLNDSDKSVACGRGTHIFVICMTDCLCEPPRPKSGALFTLVITCVLSRSARFFDAKRRLILAVGIRSLNTKSDYLKMPRPCAIGIYTSLRRIAAIELSRGFQPTVAGLKDHRVA
jgi:hypothetical protein